MAARILVVEDHPVNRKVAVAMLENLGYTVEAVENGLEAVETTSRSTYEAILMDVQMPEMDGFKATAWIRQREGPSQRTPIIALTASLMPGDRESCLAAGMDDYLSKPVRLEALDATLRKWIGRAAVASAPSGVLPPDHPLRSLEAQGRADVVAEIIELFLDATPVRIEGLRNAHQKQDGTGLGSLAHSLKGAALQIGARQMADLCARLQIAGRQADWAGADAILREIEADYEPLRELLEDERKRLKTP